MPFGLLKSISEIYWNGLQGGVRNKIESEATINWTMSIGRIQIIFEIISKSIKIIARAQTVDIKRP